MTPFPNAILTHAKTDYPLAKTWPITLSSNVFAIRIPWSIVWLASAK